MIFKKLSLLLYTFKARLGIVVVYVVLIYLYSGTQWHHQPLAFHYNTRAFPFSHIFCQLCAISCHISFLFPYLMICLPHLLPFLGCYSVTLAVSLQLFSFDMAFSCLCNQDVFSFHVPHTAWYFSYCHVLLQTETSSFILPQTWAESWYTTVHWSMYLVFDEEPQINLSIRKKIPYWQLSSELEHESFL